MAHVISQTVVLPFFVLQHIHTGMTLTMTLSTFELSIVCERVLQL